MRRVSRRSKLLMAPVPIPQSPVQIPDVPQSPVPIPDVLEPVPISDVPPSPVHIPQPPVQIPDVLEPVQIPLSPNILATCADSSVTSPTVTCADSTCADSRNSRTCADSSVTSPTVTCADSTCADSRGSRTCADSSVTSPTATYADSPRTCADSRGSRTCADSPRTYEHSTCSTTCADSSVTSPTATWLQILPEPMNILHVSQPVQIPVSQVPQSPMQILHVSEPVQIPVSQVPQSPVQSLPEPMQLLPELDMLDPLESTDAFDQLMSFVFGPQELQLLHTVPSILMEISSLSWMNLKREPMDLTMPRLNSCVKNLSDLNLSNPWICLSIVLSVNNLSEPSNPCLSIVACSSLSYICIFYVQTCVKKSIGAIQPMDLSIVACSSLYIFFQ
ncbi:hypothetical protein TNCV_109301 [Trichonephila clavipes]|nr:hypothetical protein TNCV_109301 [Trichonephila clavipes]